VKGSVSESPTRFPRDLTMNSSFVLRRSHNTSAKRTSSLGRTTWVDSFFLVTFIVLLPLQSDIPKIGGASATFLIIGMAGLYLILFRLNVLKRVGMHPVFIAGYIFAGLSLFMEFFHDSNQFYIGQRIGLMVVGGVIVASLCRDRKALLSAAYGFCLAGVIVSSLLILSVYGTLNMASADDFRGANQARGEAFAETPSDNDINLLGFHCAQGVIAALALGLTANSGFRRSFFLILGTFMLLATFLPMSRGAVAILGVSCTAVAYSYGIFKPKLLLALGILILGMSFLVPDVVFTRFQFSLDEKSAVAEDDGRSKLFTAAWKELPEYFFTGVGNSDFFGKWGRATDFWNSQKRAVVGPHNIFLITTVFWGLPGLLALLAIVWKAYQGFPKYGKGDRLGIFLLGISVATLLEACVIQTLESKQFSITLGLIVGGSLWVWQNSGVNFKLKSKNFPMAKTISCKMV